MIAACRNRGEVGLVSTWGRSVPDRHLSAREFGTTWCDARDQIVLIRIFLRFLRRPSPVLRKGRVMNDDGAGRDEWLKVKWTTDIHRGAVPCEKDGRFQQMTASGRLPGPGRRGGPTTRVFHAWIGPIAWDRSSWALPGAIRIGRDAAGRRQAGIRLSHGFRHGWLCERRVLGIIAADAVSGTGVKWSVSI